MNENDIVRVISLLVIFVTGILFGKLYFDLKSMHPKKKPKVKNNEESSTEISSEQKSRENDLPGKIKDIESEFNEEESKGKVKKKKKSKEAESTDSGFNEQDSE